MHGLLDVPAVVLQGRLTLLQGDPVDRLLHLKHTSLVLTLPGAASQLLGASNVSYGGSSLPSDLDSANWRITCATLTQ